MEILTVEALSFRYPECKDPAVRDVSFSVTEGELILLCGATGSGKSTLLRLLKRELVPLGEQHGRVLYRGVPTEAMSEKLSVSAVGFVGQRPEQQLVTDKVWHELAFGAENLNVPQDVIARRVAETACYFGIEGWFSKNVSELSGGQKQLLNLASVMVMSPKLLILDEPTAQLDPIAASEFITTVKKLNDDLGLTVIIAEHRLEELLPLCDRMLVMENGRLTKNGAPRSVVPTFTCSDALFSAMPTAARLAGMLDYRGDAPPLTVREGRAFIENSYDDHLRALPDRSATATATTATTARPALELNEVYFRFARELPDVLHGLDLTVYEGEIFCILGGNGAGKSTALGVAAGLLKPYSGHIRILGQSIKGYRDMSLYKNTLSFLPQDVQTVFLKNTVREELYDVGITEEELPYRLDHLLDKHPYDCSGGEQQLIALAKVLASRPRILLVDEPTKGLDALRRAELASIFKGLRDTGVTVIIVTHDTEFAAECATRCAMLFRGQLVSIGTPEEFFSENSFYTTAAARIGRGHFDRAVTVGQLAELCRRNGTKNGGTSCLP